MEDDGRNFLKKLIRKRRTHKPSLFKATPPDSSLISIYDMHGMPLTIIALNPPGLLLDKERINKVGKLLERSLPVMVATLFYKTKGSEKQKNGGMPPGYL